MSSSDGAPESRLDFAYPITFDPTERVRSPVARPWRLRKAALLAGTVAAVALAITGRTPEPATAPGAPVAIVAAPAAVAVAPAPARVPAPAAAPKSAPTRLARVDPPPRRPVLATVTVSTRSAPLLSTRDAPPVLAGPSPLPRPAARVPEIARVATPTLDANRPMRRPDSGAAVRAAVKATARAAEGRPLPRPDGGAPAPVVVASLSPAPAEMALAAAIAAPLARPAAVPVAAPAAKRAAAPAPRVAQPAKPAAPVKAAPAAAAPKVVRGPSPAARAPAAPVAKVATQAPLRVVPVAAPAKPAVRAAPVRVAALAPVTPRAAAPAAARPQATARKPVAAPQRTATRKPAPTTEREGLSRGNVSLIGVFSGEEGRHALLLLPDGSIERVRPGDRIRGAQVAAIDSDSVRLSGRGRDTLLRLPD